MRKEVGKGKKGRERGKGRGKERKYVISEKRRIIGDGDGNGIVFERIRRRLRGGGGRLTEGTTRSRGRNGRRTNGNTPSSTVILNDGCNMQLIKGRRRGRGKEEEEGRRKEKKYKKTHLWQTS